MDATPLRYKKKMIGFRLPGLNGSPPGHVGYCMMTFVIRNKLPELMKDRNAYVNQVRNLARTWKLGDVEAARMRQFAVKWAAWSTTHMPEIESTGNREYLDVAEKFVEELLSEPASTATKSFYGNVVLIGFDDAFVQEVRTRTGAVDVIEVPGNLKRDVATLPELGTLIKINALTCVVWLPFFLVVQCGSLDIQMDRFGCLSNNTIGGMHV
jgi:hypothetical protein